MTAWWQSPKNPPEKLIKSHRLAPTKGPADSVSSPVSEGSVQLLAARTPTHIQWGCPWTLLTCPWPFWSAKPTLYFPPSSKCKPERQEAARSHCLLFPNFCDPIVAISSSFFSLTEFWILLKPPYRSFLWLVHCSFHRVTRWLNLLRGLYLQG